MGSGRDIRVAVTCGLLLPLLILAAGCGKAKQAAHNQTKGAADTMAQWHRDALCDFGNLETDPMSRNPCSPVIDDPHFLGIAINAPEDVVYARDRPDEASGAFAVIPVCGTCCFDYDYLGLRGEVHQEILLVVVDAKTQETWSGKLNQIPNPEPKPAEMREGGGPTEGVLLESYFNANLAEILALPARPAEYIIYALLGEYRSNTVRIHLKERN